MLKITYFNGTNERKKMNTIEKTVSNISEETSSQVIEPKPTDSLFNDEKAVDASVTNTNKKIKKTLSEKIKEFKANKKAEIEAKEKAEEEKEQQIKKEYWSNLTKKVDIMVKTNYVTVVGFYGKDNVRLYTGKKFVQIVFFKLILIYLLASTYLPKMANGIVDDFLSNVKEGSVVSEMIGKNYSLYGIDLDGKPESIEAVLRLNNNKDVLMKDKVKLDSKIQIRSSSNNEVYMEQRTARDVYKIDDLVIKQR